MFLASLIIQFQKGVLPVELLMYKIENHYSVTVQ